MYSFNLAMYGYELLIRIRDYASYFIGAKFV